jgi:DNA-binding transcriptional ArsR family regulator
VPASPPSSDAPGRDVFSALADSTRRAILDLLREQPELTAGVLAASFPQISRPAVSKHLGVLREAGLVRVREDGREWHYALDPEPLAAAHREWWAAFVPLWDDRLARLKRNAERASARAATRARPGRA